MSKDLQSSGRRVVALRVAECRDIRGTKGDCHCCAGPALGSRGGFTLIELLIVAVLMSVLMLGVWTMFRTWSRLYTQGQTRATRLQLIRSLSDQFTDDLRAAHQLPPKRRSQEPVAAGGPPLPPPPPDEAGNNSPTFMGGSDWLLVEVIQPANPWQSLPETDSTSLDSTQYGTSDDEPVGLVAPELQLVLYSFVPPKSDPLDSLSATVDEMAADDDVETIVGNEEGEEEVQPVSGLQRLTIAQEYLGAWSAAVGQRAEAAAIKGPRDAIFWIREQVSGMGEESDSLASPTGSVVGLESQSSSDTDLLASILERDDVPEIAWLEFRYFDGSSWRTSWESESIGRLPVAVEMRFELVEEKKSPLRPSGDDDTELVNEQPADQGVSDRLNSDLPLNSPTEDRGLRGETGEETAPTYRRCVIYLNPQDQPPGQTRSGGGPGSSDSGGPPPSGPS